MNHPKTPLGTPTRSADWTAEKYRRSARRGELMKSLQDWKRPFDDPIPLPAAANSPEDSARGLLRMGGPQKKRQWRSTILHAEERARKTVDIGE